MIRLLTFSGLVAALTLAAFLLAATSQSGSVQAAEDNGNCQVIHVSVDEGYGISGTVQRRICE